MLGIPSCQLRGVERLAVDGDQAPPCLTRWILPNLERLHRADRHLPEHRDVDLLALLEVVEANRFGVLEPNHLAHLPCEGVEIWRRLDGNGRGRDRQQRRVPRGGRRRAQRDEMASINSSVEHLMGIDGFDGVY